MSHLEPGVKEVKRKETIQNNRRPRCQTQMNNTSLNGQRGRTVSLCMH